MSRLNVQNEVVCLDEPSSSYIGEDRFVIYALGGRKGKWQYSNLLYPWLLQNLHKYDAVILHGLWLYHGYATNKAVNAIDNRKGGDSPTRAAIKLFVMPHGMLDPYFQQAGKRRLKAIRNFFYWKLVESKIINSANGVLFTSSEELLLARQTFAPYQPKREMNIGYGIPSPAEYTPEMKRAFSLTVPGLGESPYLLFLSRIHQKKGVDMLVEAYSILKRKIIKEGADITSFPRLVIAGPGWDEQYGKNILYGLNNQPALNGFVFTTGMLKGDAKWGAFYGADAFVLPSHQENFGIAVVEAMSCGKPVLMSNKINIWQDIETAGAGFVGDDTLEGCINTLEQWVGLPVPSRQVMAKAALACYVANYSISSATQKMVRAIAEN
jgi:glycosyltransferase involved in cell wall biosynthesis